MQNLVLIALPVNNTKPGTYSIVCKQYETLFLFIYMWNTFCKQYKTWFLIT